MKSSQKFNIGSGPIEILHTRNIGKVVDDSLFVPIRVGLKFVTKGNNFEGAGMYVNTGAKGREAEANYLALKICKQSLPGLTTGLTYIGKETTLRYVRTLTLDGSYVKDFHSSIFQGSYADSAGLRGGAGYLNWLYLNPKMLLGVDISYIGSAYHINEVGYVPMKGANASVFLGRMFPLEKGIIDYYGVGLFYGGGREWIATHMTQGMTGWFFFKTRNNYNGNIIFLYRDVYENIGGAEIHYKSKCINFNGGFDSSLFAFNLWCNVLYNFNYYAQHLGYQGNIGAHISLIPLSKLNLRLFFNITPYWEENFGWRHIFSSQKLENLYVTLSPFFGYHFSRNFHFDLRCEGVWIESLGKIYRYRINPVVSYNFSPKSWIYLVYTRTEDYDPMEDKFMTSDEGTVFKIRYLLYF